MLIYALVIASRIGFSRSSNERREKATQGPLGWYFWFMGSSLMQTAFILLIMSHVSKMGKSLKPLMVTDRSKDFGLLKRALFSIFAPSKLWMLTSAEQLKQRQEHIVKAIEQQAVKNGGKIGKVALQKIESVKSLFAGAIKYSYLNSFIGLMFAFIVLGVGIPLLNIVLTKASVKQKYASSNQKPITSSPSGNPNPFRNTEPLPPRQRHPQWQKTFYSG